MENCPNNCCEVYYGENPSLHSLHNISGSEIVLTEKDLQKFIGQKWAFKYLSEVTKDGNKHFIKTDKNGKCSAFENGRCSIHSIKPTVCKRFPLYIDPIQGISAVKTCPAVSDDIPLDGYKEQQSALKSMYEFWLGELNASNEKDLI
jgi:Fe-S-cluster containining protein